MARKPNRALEPENSRSEPQIASDTDFHPGFTTNSAWVFLINTSAYEGGRSAGSLAWAGIETLFFDRPARPDLRHAHAAVPCPSATGKRWIAE